MLVDVVRALARREQIQPSLRELGHRHRKYGVRGEDYRAFDLALMWTLELFLDKEFTSEVRQAWESFYTLISGLMQQSGVRVSAQPIVEFEAEQ